jgi:hypothetical protein
MPAVSPRDVQAALVLQGLSFASWARARGHKPDTVRRVVIRWAGRKDRVPYGSFARSILADLTRDLRMTIVPGIAPSPTKSDPGREAA